MAEKRGNARHNTKASARHKSGSRHILKHETLKKKHIKHVHRPVPPAQKIEELAKRAPHELEEEFFQPSPIHRGRYHIPLGIKFLIGYLIFLSVLYLVSFISGITFPTTILFGTMITGTRALIINAVLVLLILFMIFGFWKRLAYTFDLAVGFFSFAALNATISLIIFDAAEHPVFKKLLLLSFISLIIMDVVIIWYILHERKYFYSEKFRERPVHHRDKIFLYLIITFWTLTLLIGLTLGVQFYKDTTHKIDIMVKEMTPNMYMGSLLCDAKEGTDKDLCKLIIATAMSSKDRPKEEVTGICNSIQSDFYKFTCMRSIVS